MPVALIDIESVVDNLRGIKADLESHVGQLEGHDHASQRYAVGIAIDQLGQRIVALEATARHLGSTDVEVPRLSRDEAHAVDRALALLDCELVLESGPLAPKSWARVRLVLSATDDLLLAAARADTPIEDSSDSPTRRGPALVLALSRAKG
jgi:hypothetical protein